MTQQKRVIIIAGPNGAGKTTFAREFLPAEAGLPVFVNADLIAEGLSPFNPEVAAVRAGRVMLQEIDAHAAAGSSFAFETTLARPLVSAENRWMADRGLYRRADLPFPAVAGRGHPARGGAGETGRA